MRSFPGNTPAGLAAFRRIDGPGAAILLICDHASNLVPDSVDLGVPEELIQSHIAWDIGAAAVTERLAARLAAPALLAGVSRLVVDCNRPFPESIVTASDGVAIPGNRQLPASAIAMRRSLHQAYHHGIETHIREQQPELLVAIHSFTPALASRPLPRPWPVALLWNTDRRATELALRALEGEPDLPGPVGENEPYSGKVLNYTMNLHAEANNLPYLGFEIRQDLLTDAGGQQRYAEVLARAIERTCAGL